MTKKERIAATIAGEQPDRLPFGAWMHSTVHERTPKRFAQFTVDFYQKYDPDFVKVMYDWNYDTPVNYQFVQEPSLWARLEDFEPTVGAFANQIEALKIIKDSVGTDVPIVQTIFSPFHIANRLAYRRVIKDLETDADAVLSGLEVIARNSIRFAEACRREVGIDGFFFGAWGCESSWLSPEKYTEFVMPSDRRVIEALRQAETVMLHIHGESDSYFDLLKEYPCDVISWEDRLAGPSISEARERTAKCLMGGINHIAAATSGPEQVREEANRAIRSAGGTGLILAPGCTFLDHTPEQNISVLKSAVES